MIWNFGLDLDSVKVTQYVEYRSKFYLFDIRTQMYN